MQAVSCALPMASEVGDGRSGELVDALRYAAGPPLLWGLPLLHHFLQLAQGAVCKGRGGQAAASEAAVGAQELRLGL